MALAKIKDAYREAIVGFNGSGLPLGQRDDIDALAILALTSGDRHLQSFFEVLPSLEELQKGQFEKKVTQRRPRKS